VLQIFSTAERFERLRGLLPQLDALVILAVVLVLCGAAKELWAKVRAWAKVRRRVAWMVWKVAEALDCSPFQYRQTMQSQMLLH
jgi:hypothetical protein